LFKEFHGSGISFFILKSRLLWWSVKVPVNRVHSTANRKNQTANPLLALFMHVFKIASAIIYCILCFNVLKMVLLLLFFKEPLAGNKNSKNAHNNLARSLLVTS
jgi:hypothetical protein